MAKLFENHLEKTPTFDKTRKTSRSAMIEQSEAHFDVCHYAGTVRLKKHVRARRSERKPHNILKVSYNVHGWLNTNKDPISDSLIETLSNSSETFVSRMFADATGSTKLHQSSHVNTTVRSHT